jgi:outer membrane biosynthesis protein TonB
MGPSQSSVSSKIAGRKASETPEESKVRKEEREEKESASDTSETPEESEVQKVKKREKNEAKGKENKERKGKENKKKKEREEEKETSRRLTLSSFSLAAFHRKCLGGNWTSVQSDAPTRRERGRGFWCTFQSPCCEL